MIDASFFTKKKGLTAGLYPGEVIDVDDPLKVGRIKIKVFGLFDDIEEEHIPWAVQMLDSIDGSFYESEEEQEEQEEQDTYGYFSVPQKGSIALVQFLEGNPLFPVYRGYLLTKNNMMEEAKEDYPKRAVVKLKNKSWIVIDKETKEIFINSSGDVNLTVFGDISQTVIGNQEVIYTDDKSDIPDHIKNLKGTEIDKVEEGSPNHPFKGEEILPNKIPKGNFYTEVKGNQTVRVKGSRKVIIEGDDITEVNGSSLINIKKDRLTEIGQNDLIDVVKNLKFLAERIDLNE